MEAVVDLDVRAAFLKAIPSLFSSADDLIAAAGKKIRCEIYQRGERVYQEMDQPDHVFALQHGRVRTLRITPQGKDVTLYLVEPGQLFGVDSIVRGDSLAHPFGHDAEALDTRTVVVSLPSREFGIVAQHRPELMGQVVSSLWTQSQDLMDQAETRAFHDVNGRIANAILMLAHKEGVPTAHGVEIAPVLTHDQLAALAGTRRESVTTVIGNWKKLGIVSCDEAERSMMILDIEELAEMRGGGASAQFVVDSLVAQLSAVHSLARESRIAEVESVRERRKAAYQAYNRR